MVSNYQKKSGVDITPAYEVDHLAMAMSLIGSTGGVALLPAYAEKFMPAGVTSRPLEGNAPIIDLVLGYRRSNEPPVLQLLLSRLDKLVASVLKKGDGKTAQG